MRHRIAILIGAIATTAAGHVHAAAILVPQNGVPLKVVSLAAANEGVWLAPGSQGYLFATDTAVTLTGSAWTCLPSSTNNWFAIPKANPNDASLENPAYRDYVNTVMLAYTMNKGVLLRVDGCHAGVPRVVGMQIL